MSDCCAPSFTSGHNKEKCPSCGYESTKVTVRTIVHQIMHSWLWNDNGQKCYFCENPKCDVVYFWNSDSVILKSQLRGIVGLKEQSVDAPLCYCFGVSKADAKNDPSIRDFVLTKTKQGTC